MATNKTIQPSGETIVIPDFDEKPDVRILVQDISKLADNDDAINQALSALNSNLGRIRTGSKNAETITVSPSVGVEINSVTLARGVWLVIACADWAASGDGYRQISIGGDTLNPSRNYAVTTNGISNKETYQQAIRIIATSDEMEIKMYARHNASNSINVYPYSYAVQIGMV